MDSVEFRWLQIDADGFKWIETNRKWIPAAQQLNHILLFQGEKSL